MPPGLLFLIIDSEGAAGSLQAATPPSSWYTSGAVVSLERARVFQRNWQVRLAIFALSRFACIIASSVTWPSLQMICSRRWQHALVILRSLAAS